MLLEVKVRKLPETPPDVVSYLMLGDEGRYDFNNQNVGFWHRFDSSMSDPQGFFSILRDALHFNSEWVKILNEEIKKPEHANHSRQITEKIREFYQHLYVGPMIGNLPYFKQWALPVEYSENREPVFAE